VGDVAREAFETLKCDPRAAGIELHADFVTPLPRSIETDPIRLRQVLLNLLSNAVKFTERGSITLRCAYLPDEQAVRFDVADTGIGIAPEAIDKLRAFEAFTQADDATTREYGGTGLGLRICKSLTNLLGGDLSFESTQGVGSVFTATIATGTIDPAELVEPVAFAAEPGGPDVEAGPPVRRATVVDGEGALARRRILLVEDGLDNQRLLTLHLTRAGAAVTIVKNGQAAIDQIADASFDLVLMDMQMPVMDGYTATRRLREAGETLPVVALTANAMQGDRETTLAAGCTDYLSKPVDRDLLVSTCRRLIADAERNDRRAA